MHLSTAGFEWIRSGTKVSSLVYAVACCCDSVARATVKNIKQFNVLYGCTWCLSRGEQVEKGRGTVRAYTDVENLNLCNDGDMRKWVEEADLTGNGGKRTVCTCVAPSI